MVGNSTVTYIIHNTFRAIWNVLKYVVMKKPTKEDWSNIAFFMGALQFSHCVRSINGKHIQIIKPVSSGSKFFNIKYISPLYY